MGFFSSLFMPAVIAPIEAIGNVVDKLFTSDDERLEKKIVLQRLAQQPALAQAEINKVEASHRSLFVAGWRSAIGWTCAIALFNQFLIAPYIQFFFHVTLPTTGTQALHNLVLGLLGLGTLRTVEKLAGRTK